MSKKFKVPLGLASGSADPLTGAPGDLFYRTDLNVVRIYKQTVGWISVEGALDEIDGGSPTESYDSVTVGYTGPTGPPGPDSYTPTTSSDWDLVPSTFSDAMDELASRIRALEP